MREVVDDLYLRAFALVEGDPAFSHTEAMAIARAVVSDPQARLEPAGDDRATPPDAGSRSPRRCARRSTSASAGSASCPTTTCSPSSPPPSSPPTPPARTRMRDRWSIVLVDEFQDTDPVQWEVLDRAFSGVARMVLIGDPKQAIYAFRGGDVTTYLAATETATRQTLAVNHRSDAGLLDAFQELLDGAELGDPRIVVRPVTAHHGASRLQGAPSAAPLRLRAVRRDTFGKGPRAMLSVGQVRPHVAHDLAADVRRLLDAHPTFDGRPLERRDVAVICYRHADLAAAQEALHAVGVPAVIAGGGSVFATPAAVEWLTLLEALEQPHRSPRVRAAALTCFFGHTATDLDAAGERLTDDVAETLRRWVDVVSRRGVAAVLEASSAGGLTARVLREVGGDRRLTDLRHIGEALHEMATVHRMGVVALLAWLRDQVREGRSGRGTERTRRLDSDAAAVQLVTIHASKGLQYPVVYLPALADRFVPKPTRPLFHDADGARCLDVGGGGGEAWRDHVDRWTHEEAGEWLRLLYVAITRAQSQVVAWWAPTKNAVASPLHRLLSRAAGESAVPPSPPVPSDDDLVALLGAWAERGGPAPEASRLVEPGPPAPPDAVGALAVRRFGREVDTTWRRTSYSALSAVEVVAPTGGVGSEPEVTAKDDEPADAVPLETAAARGDLDSDVPSPMAGLPVGATFGSLVHAVLEHTDPEAPDLRAELLGHIEEQRSWWPVELDPGELADALVAVCDSPLGPLADDRTLRSLGLRDRLRELDFELPLAGGTRLGDLAPLLRRHLPEGDPVRQYADALDQPALGDQPLLGYLTGSVDIVLRVGAGDGVRYLVVDYKTNWLGPRDEPHTAAGYRPAALVAAMGHSDYPLQALLYAVVLHRFLRWRLRGYDPGQHLGGVLYLYLRGMCGPDTPRVDGAPCGVFAWRPPVALVEAISDLLDGEAAR